MAFFVLFFVYWIEGVFLNWMQKTLVNKFVCKWIYQNRKWTKNELTQVADNCIHLHMIILCIKYQHITSTVIISCGKFSCIHRFEFMLKILYPRRCWRIQEKKIAKSFITNGWVVWKMLNCCYLNLCRTKIPSQLRCFHRLWEETPPSLLKMLLLRYLFLKWATRWTKIRSTSFLI